MPKNWNKPLVLLALGLVFVSFRMHKFYVSQYDLYIEKDAFQTSVRIFTDDLERALQKQDPQIRLDKTSDVKYQDSLIFAYIQTHLTLKADQKTLVPEWVG